MEQDEFSLLTLQDPKQIIIDVKYFSPIFLWRKSPIREATPHFFNISLSIISSDIGRLGKSLYGIFLSNIICSFMDTNNNYVHFLQKTGHISNLCPFF